MKVASRVARPRSRTSKPVANGSRVPRCPMLRSPKILRTCWTTSYDVIPAGLSTSSSPSTGAPDCAERSAFVASTSGRRVLLLDVGEERLDARRASDGVVLLELDLGCHAQLQLARDPRPQMRRDAVEAVEGRLLFRVATEHAHVDPGVTEVGCDLGARHCHEADDARILGRFGEECRYLDADRFGDAVRSARVTQKRPPPR